MPDIIQWGARYYTVSKVILVISLSLNQAEQKQLPVEVHFRKLKPYFVNQTLCQDFENVT